MLPGYRRIGHKGADAIVGGNTLASFRAAVEQGVDLIELDVLRTPEGRFVIAHDYPDAASRPVLSLAEALEAFTRPPLDGVQIDCDIKLPGREAEFAGAVKGAGMLERTMVSTMEVETLRRLRALEPGLRLGWTFPKTRVDWPRKRWAAPALIAALFAMRRRLPRILPRRAEELGLFATWVYHPVITPALVTSARSAGVELIAWTVDDPNRIAQLAEWGVDGICSNDPRLFGAPADRADPEFVPKLPDPGDLEL